MQGHDASLAKPTCTAPSAIARDAIENAIPPERAAQIAILLRNFYRVNAGSCAA